MALKEKALKRLCEKMARAGIPFALAGPWMLSQRGWEIPWHGFDVIVDAEQSAEADRVLSRLGMRTPVLQSSDASEIHYHFDGADIQLYAGFTLPGTVYRLPSDPETVTVLGQEVPLMTPEDWYVLLQYSGRSSDALALQPYFQANPFRRQALAPSLEGLSLPEGLFPIE